VSRLEDLSSYQAQLPMADYNLFGAREHLRRVQGHLVLFPLYFLCKSSLYPSIMTKEGLAPVSLFT
jgi:hypothetical protein